MNSKILLNREHENRLIIGRVDQPICGLHFHSHIEVYLITEGEVEVWINEKQTVLHEGECVLALPFDTHGYHSSGKASAAYLIIPADLCPPFTAAVQGKYPKEPFFKDRSLFEQLMRRFEEIEQTDDDLIRQGHVYVLLGTLLQKLQFERERHPVDPPLAARLLSYVSTHIEEELTLRSIAAALGYNANYLSAYFRNTLQIGLPQYINLLRLRRAVLMMHSSDLTVSECAYAAGFSSLRTFYRAFEREFHCAPTRYLRDKNSGGFR